MKTSATGAFVNQFVAGLIVLIGLGGTFGVGTVWLRHQVSVLADSNRTLQAQIADVGRNIASVTTLVAEAQRSDVLRSENDSMHLGLAAMTPTQVIPVNEDPMIRLASRANRRIFESETGSDFANAEIRLDLSPAASGAAPAAAVARASMPARRPAAGDGVDQGSGIQLALER